MTLFVNPDANVDSGSDGALGAGISAGTAIVGKIYDNWYNSPKHQRKMIERAGYNPNMVMPAGYQSSGGFDSAVSAASNYYGSAPERANSKSSRLNATSQVTLRQVQAEQSRQAVRNSKADVAVKAAQIRNINAQTAGARMNNQLKAEEVKFKKLPTKWNEPRSVGRLLDYGIDKVKGLFSRHTSSGVVPGYNNVDRGKVRKNYTRSTVSSRFI